MIKIEIQIALCFCKFILSGKKGIILSFQINQMKTINLEKKENKLTTDLEIEG
jgi:hypothetical protein